MTAVGYPGPVALHGHRTSSGSLLAKLLVGLLIVAAALVAANPSSPGNLVAAPGGAAAPTVVSHAAGLPVEPVESKRAPHTAAARQRVRAARELSRCLHQARRTSAEPATCLREHRAH
jgi:hypothetical protein